MGEFVHNRQLYICDSFTDEDKAIIWKICSPNFKITLIIVISQFLNALRFTENIAFHVSCSVEIERALILQETEI